jgi:hypothetical protein
MSIASQLLTGSESRALLLRGFLSISNTDKTFSDKLKKLTDYIFQEMGNNQEICLKLKALTEEIFVPEQALPILENKTINDFFFNTAVMLACLDSPSDSEIALLKTYAKLFNYPEKELELLLNDIVNEFNQVNTDFIIKSVAKIIHGYLYFFKYGKTPPESFNSMRQLYVLTNGRFNDLIAFIAGYFNPPVEIDFNKGMIGALSQNSINNILEEINSTGFCILPEKLPADLCDKLLEFSLKTPAHTMENPNNYLLYNKDYQDSVKYNFNSQTLAENETVQKLFTDPLFFAVAQSYLGTVPVLDSATMWWSTPYRAEIDTSAKAAQLYHFDMDRFRFLLVFIYLTDVDSKNGPHCYVKGSHQRKPLNLLMDARIPDDIISKFYSSEDIVEITAPRGTIIIADTRGFHKGKTLEAGHRLMLQLTFTTGLFGQNYPSVKINNHFSPETISIINKYKYSFSNFKV